MAGLKIILLKNNKDIIKVKNSKCLPQIITKTNIVNNDVIN